MTHDELLVKIEDMYEFAGINGATTSVYPALRAVVGLHRPEEIKLLSGEVEDTYCFECEGLTEYPCPTIQAIEKELG